jgi:hypothetical protein
LLITGSDLVKIGDLWLFFAECEQEIFGPVFYEHGDENSGSKKKKKKFSQHMSDCEGFTFPVNK